MKQDTKILVIDDEEGIRDWLLFELEGQGYTVSTAQSGKEGIDKVKKDKFDIAIVDIKMPVMDGIAVLEEIKKIDPYIEVIISTGYGTIELAIESINKGACDFITKPNSVEEITIVIEKALEKQRLKETIKLYEMTRVILSTLETDALSRLSINLAMKALKCDGALLMINDNGQKLYPAASSNGIKIDMEIAVRSVKEKEPQLAGGNSIMAVPLIEKNEALGVLFLSRKEGAGHFIEKDLKKAVLFSSQLSLAVKNANLFKSKGKNM